MFTVGGGVVKNHQESGNDKTKRSAMNNLTCHVFFVSMTLLISGDGANDVSMIQVADVGVGISGQEGMQVRRSRRDMAMYVWTIEMCLLVNVSSTIFIAVLQNTLYRTAE